MKAKLEQCMLVSLATALVALGCHASGCYSVAKPTGPVNWTVQCAAQIPVIGDSLLASPLCRDSDTTILLKIGNMLDKTRFTVDTDLLMKKMRTYLVNHGCGRIAVFDNDADVTAFCERRREKRAREAYKGEIKYLAGCILRSAILRDAKHKLVVVPMDGMNVAATKAASMSNDLRIIFYLNSVSLYFRYLTNFLSYLGLCPSSPDLLPIPGSPPQFRCRPDLLLPAP